METNTKYKRGKNPNSMKNLKPIKKGSVLNPIGANAHDPIKKAIKKFTNQYLIEVINMAVMGNLKGLQDVVKNPDSPAIQVGVAKCLFTAISKGDWDTLESIIVRIIGKVPDKIEHSGSVDTAPQIVITLPDNGRNAPDDKK